MASFKVDLSKLQKMIERFKNNGLEEFAKTLPNEKGIHAIISQSIADNFSKQGPGWKPLKKSTIWRSISMAKKRQIKKLPKNKRDDALNSARSILDRGGPLKKSVTTPSEHSIRKSDNKSLIWGTDLFYASIHNRGGTINHPGTKNGFGMGIKIKPHSIPIPKREFLKIRPEWMKQLNAYVKELLERKLADIFKG